MGEDEIWKTIIGASKYEISNLGKVKHKRYKKPVSYSRMKKGNQLDLVSFIDDRGIRVRRTVGAEVAKHFIDNPNNYKYIRYKDGDYYNHSSDNIEWTELRQEHHKNTAINDEGRTCTKCLKFKTWDNFSNSSKGVRGKLHSCNECNREYYDENKEHLSKMSSLNYYNNWEENRRKAKEYYYNNQDKISEANKKYREEHKEEIYHRRHVDPTSYELFKDRLTIDEDPRPDEDGNLEVKCAYCGEYFTPSYAYAESRYIALIGKSGDAENRLYCSDECKKLCPVYNTRSYPKGTKIYKDREIWGEFREYIRDLDNNQCVWCGSKDNLEVHHIIPHALNPLLDCDEDNAITLCRKHHKWIHKNISGCGYRELQKQVNDQRLSLCGEKY